MTNEEAIKFLQQLYPNGGHCWLDEQRIEAIGMAVKVLQEEPVSEDLGEYINELSKQFPEVSFAKLSRIAVRVAKWQKAQFEKNRLKHCNSITNEQAELEQGFIDQHLDKHQRMPTFLDAIEYGMRLQKEQMMKDVMPCVLEWYDGFVLNFTEKQLKDVVTKNNINIGDKVKLIVIKED